MNNELARRCGLFQQGAKRLYDGERIKTMKGDMWLFELYHFLGDCAKALAATQEQRKQLSDYTNAELGVLGDPRVGVCLPTSEQPARFDGDKAIAEFEAKHGGGK